MSMILNHKHQEQSVSWQPYLKYGERQFKKQKAIIYSQGEVGNGFYYLHSGLVKIMTVKPEGSRKILDIHGEGKLFGEQAIDQLAYFSTAVAVENTVLYYFSREVFREMVQACPDFLSFFIDSIVQKMRILSEDILLKTFTAEQYIAYSLSKFCRTYRSDRISMTQQDIANCTGLTRITVYKILKKWKENDLIDIQNRMIVIKEREKLSRLYI
ncbi:MULTISPECIES: Crp/Fnr family transcriptional regulator [Brevibacillus]|uniref:Crp/Fnr family transcriptional regulator n=1 Tax=Brevibacillus invocatus TaxID=173959 RepID=A0A3M8C767_9BACL|nr:MULTISPECIES: Crp/Fnr family transcriptional regulator [Brevibacillus]MCM3078599.1 Crp/Fnr family transcriptional regulator [Brevibacillus invocatus]MCM3429152.1 Crp/Fnr family transcriptional regulator [Brevibacillus invocatus]MDH4616168.1 Crp/Fnr family transcriptional regulator [Brevibacillus sp. AY1]RNB71247.1 Crp/Fnr family transcriptional regulator [Brevibacillus invocatus]